MTSKISFSKLLKENLRRRPGMIALTTLYFLFTLIMFIITIQNTMAFEGWTRKEVYDQILVSIGFSDMSVLCALLGVIVGVSGFAWMHSGKKSDFYFELPPELIAERYNLVDTYLKTYTDKLDRLYVYESANNQFTLCCNYQKGILLP